MSDKYPALDIESDIPESERDDTDFLSREKELMGDEFQTEQDGVLNDDEDDDINEFKEQFPDVEDQGQVEPVNESVDDEFEGFGNESNGHKLTEGESQALTEWKQRRDLEIEQRESANAKKKEDIVAKGQQALDDFYDNYNSKREEHSKEVLKEQEDFLSKRDGFLTRGTLWDRVNELISETGESNSETRDKSRFKLLLTKLKGKENVPGAGGYQE